MAATDINRTISGRVDAEIKRQGRSVSEVAVNANMSPATLYRRLNGTQSWKVHEVIDVARALKVTSRSLQREQAA